LAYGAPGYSEGFIAGEGASLLQLLPEWVSRALQVVAESDKDLIIAAVLVYVSSTVIYALRTFIIARKLGIQLRYYDSYISYIFNIFINNITPSAKAGGELARAAYIARSTGSHIATIVNIIAFERATEALGLALLSIATALYGIFDTKNTQYIVAAALLIVVSMTLVYHYWDKIFEKLMVRLEDKGVISFRGQNITRFKDFFRNRKLFLIGVTFGVTVWFLDALRLYTIALAVGARAALAMFIGVSVLYAVIGLVAITPGGLGIVEGGLTAALVALGISPHDAFAITLIERLISYGLGTALGALGLLMTGGIRAWRTLKLQ
jgi:uncharacterized protein (TIRG00374 family)